MSGLEDAKDLLTAARNDVQALNGMLDPEVFADEVFGFHAQQAAEKSLKAWIAVLGSDYPLTHNLISLLTQLEEMGCDVGELWELVQYNAFAVQYRYARFESLDAELDRPEIARRVTELLNHVQSLVG